MNQSNQTNDPLLGCLSILCHIEDIPFSEQSALAGLPIDGKGLTPTLFLRAAKHLGFVAHVAKKSLDKLSNMILPVIVLLDHDNACVIKHIDGGQVDVIFPENPEETRKISLDELTQDHTGYIIYAVAKHHYESRAEEIYTPNKKSWFWGTIFEYKSIFLYVFFAALLSNLFVLVLPIFMMNVFDRIIPNQAIDTLWVFTIGATIFFLFDLSARLLRNYLIDTVGKRADVILGNKLYAQVINLTMRDKPTSTGVLANAFTEFEIIREFFTSGTLVAFIDVPFLFLFLVVIGWIGGPIVLVPLVAIPFVICLAFFLEIPTNASVRKTLAGASQKTAILVETINGLETIKSLNAEGIFQKHWENAVSAVTRAAFFTRSLNNITINITMWFQQMVLISMVFVGVYMINQHHLTIGALTACTILTSRVMMLGAIAGYATRYARSREALRGLNKIMAIKTERDEEHHFVRRRTIEGKIQFENVSFTYPKRRVSAVENVSFTINPGEHVGIIGRIGAGKSTLLKLIVGIYQPTSGSILVDGTDNKEIDPADLREHIRYANSDATLFYGTVKENIMMAHPFADDDDFMKAAIQAGIDRFISQSTLGYDMSVGERGENLSSGQRVAMVFARTLLSTPSVMLLDDLSAYADSQYEQEMIKTLEEASKNRTLLLVTHRPAMLKLVNRLIVMDNGKVVADGPKEKVLEKIQESWEKQQQTQQTGQSRGESHESQ